VDLARHVDYVHFNPVKHGYTARVCDWPYSSFDRYVARGLLTPDWWRCSRHRRRLRRMIGGRPRQPLVRGQMRDAACPRPSACRAHLPTLRGCDYGFRARAFSAPRNDGVDGPRRHQCARLVSVNRPDKGAVHGED
jgi:hypothetical protein